MYVCCVLVQYAAGCHYRWLYVCVPGVPVLVKSGHRVLTWICLSAGGLPKIRQPYNFQKNLLRHHSGKWRGDTASEPAQWIADRVFLHAGRLRGV
jgi:hypothetical protein